MKIVFVTYDFGEYSIQHANALLEYGDVTLIIPDDLFEPHSSMIDPNVDVRTFDKPRLRQPLKQLKCNRWIIRQIRECNPDVVHFQRGHLWFNLALPFLKSFPLVITIHDPRHHVGDAGSHKTPQPIMDFGYRRANQVVVHGSQLKEVVADEIRIPKDKIHVIPHVAIGVRDIERPAATRENTILFFGRIWEYKGLEFLIRAQPHITREIPDAKIIICGRGENFERYRKLMDDAEKFEVHNRWITDQQRTTFFDQASIVVLPYIEATQSGVVPIAYAHAKPVVATRTGGLPDVVEHHRTGLLVRPKDEHELAQAIVKLLKNPQMRMEMGQAGKRKLETDLAPHTIAAQTVDVYRKAQQSHANHARPRTLRANRGSVEPTIQKIT